MAQDAQARSADPTPALAIEPHPANPRVRIALRGKVDGDAVVAAFIRLYAEQPAAVFYDRLIDLDGYSSGFELRHLQKIQAAYQATAVGAGRPCRTAFVTPDANFRLWVASMGYQFSGREFCAFASVAEAERFLDTPLGERTQAATG